MKKRIISLALSAVLIGGISFNNTAYAAVNNGWNNSNGTWSYYSNGNKVTGWIKPDGYNWYYLDNNGEMVTGFQYVNGQLYYFHEGEDSYKGAMTFDNKIGPYMFNMDGAMIYKDKNALTPDEAHLKLAQHLLGMGYNPTEYNFYYTTFDRTTNKLGVIVCGYIDKAKTMVGKPVIEMYINVATGQLSRY